MAGLAAKRAAILTLLILQYNSDIDSKGPGKMQAKQYGEEKARHEKNLQEEKDKKE
jgi:hypothetical protein